MGFKTGAYATIWSAVEDKGKWSKTRISTSRKNKETDQYEDDFSGFVNLIGAAHTEGANLKERDRIKIGDCEVNTKYDKAKKVTYTNFNIYSLEVVSGNSAAKAQESSVDSGELAEEDPF